MGKKELYQQPEHKPHTFHCNHCGQDVTAHIIDDMEIPGVEELHVTECLEGPVHRMVTFNVSLVQYGDTVCGNTSERRSSSMPSNVTCPSCLARTPGLQQRGLLEQITDPRNSVCVEAPQEARELLSRIWHLLNTEEQVR